MKLSWIQKCFVAAGTLAAFQAAGELERDVSKAFHPSDARETELRRFLHRCDCPAEGSSGVFIAEADQHHLDWRLLPSLAFLESTGGKFALHNNLFGWGNGSTRFATRREAIHRVAQALAEAPGYRGKDLRGKLWTFNKSDQYRRMVLSIMRQISPGTRPISVGD